MEGRPRPCFTSYVISWFLLRTSMKTKELKCDLTLPGLLGYSALIKVD